MPNFFASASYALMSGSLTLMPSDSARLHGGFALFLGALLGGLDRVGAERHDGQQLLDHDALLHHRLELVEDDVDRVDFGALVAMR